MFYIIAELMEREAALCWTAWCTRCVTTGLVRSTLKEVKYLENLGWGRKTKIINLQGDLRAMTGWGTPRLETKTSSWTFWRRPTPQNTGSSGSIKWDVLSFLIILTFSSYRWKTYPTEEPAKQRFHPWKRRARPGISIYLYTPCDSNVKMSQQFLSAVRCIFPCEWVCEMWTSLNRNVRHFNIISFITVILFYLINLSVFQSDLFVSWVSFPWSIYEWPVLSLISDFSFLYNFSLNNKIQ